MRNQSIRLYLYSSVAIVALTLVWGFRSVPKQAELAENTIRASVEQELLTLTGAAKAGTQALRYQLLDVLKAEGNDHPTRSFNNSMFVAATLLEWDQNAWKTLWHSSKIKTQFGNQDIRAWMIEWPLAKLNGAESFFVKVGDWQGQPYFAVAVAVRKPNNTPMIGIGIFPANQFGMVLPAERTRDAKVFDEKGFALALARPAYLGSNLKKESLVDEMIESGELNVRHEFKNAKGQRQYGMATRVAGSNLFVALEAGLQPAAPYKLGSWIYLIFAAAGALGLNWYLFFSYNKPVLVQIAELENTVTQLRKRITEVPAPEARKVEIPEDEWQADGLKTPGLPNKDFVDELPTAPALLKALTLDKVVHSALRSLEPRMKEIGIQVAEKGLQTVPVAADALQLQTAIEEVLKNGIEAMQFSTERWLTISAAVRNGRVIFSVEDTGTGVSQDNLKKVFDPFFSTKDSQGVARGLGLNVARRVIEEMKGQVRIESHQGETASGTTVEMEWPMPDSGEISTASEPEHKPMMIMEPEPISQAQADVLLSDLDLLADEYEVGKPRPAGAAINQWPEVKIRKPVVRSMD